MPALRMLIPKWRALRIIAWVWARLATEITQSGGSREPDMKALAVIAWVALPESTVTMVTPVANCPQARRRSSGEMTARSGDNGVCVDKDQFIADCFPSARISRGGNLSEVY